MTDRVESYTGRDWHVESGAIKLLLVPDRAIWGNTKVFHWPEEGGSLSLKVNRKVDWEIKCDMEMEATPMWQARTRSKGWDAQLQFERDWHGMHLLRGTETLWPGRNLRIVDSLDEKSRSLAVFEMNFVYIRWKKETRWRMQDETRVVSRWSLISTNHVRHCLTI